MNTAALDRQRRTFDPVPASARSARAFVCDALRTSGADDTVIGDYRLVVGELTTNVIEHGDGSEMVVLVDLGDPQWWDVEVVGGIAASAPPLLSPETWQVATTRQVSGRGLGIVRHLMDDVVIETRAGRVSVRCRCHR